MTTGPLSRFKVIDLTRVRAGPTCVRQLADWGADVIKIESPGGDAGLGGERLGPDFQNLHRNKRSLTLNLKDPDGVEVMRRLVAQADVVVENYRPDVKFRLGVDYESLRKVNKRIVYASISGFGQDGPYRDRPGFDQIAQGMGGLMSITGLPGQGPVRVGIPVADLTAGIFAAMGILVALLEREQSGEGQWVQSSLLGAQIAMLDFQAARWTIAKEVRLQEGKQFFVNRITFTGNTTTRDNVIRREVRVLEGAVFSTEALKYSVRRLNQLGYFKELKGDDKDMAILESMPVRSVITFPADGARLPAGTKKLDLRGHTWAGDNEVKSVDISTDYGATWKTAKVDAPKNKFAWQRFTASIDLPTSGYYEVWSRATDAKGATQPFQAANWNPQGYGGNPVSRIRVLVES